MCVSVGPVTSTTTESKPKAVGKRSREADDSATTEGAAPKRPRIEFPNEDTYVVSPSKAENEAESWMNFDPKTPSPGPAMVQLIDSFTRQHDSMKETMFQGKMFSCFIEIYLTIVIRMQCNSMSMRCIKEAPWNKQRMRTVWRLS